MENDGDRPLEPATGSAPSGQPGFLALLARCFNFSAEMKALRSPKPAGPGCDGPAPAADSGSIKAEAAPRGCFSSLFRCFLTALGFTLGFATGVVLPLFAAVVLALLVILVRLFVRHRFGPMRASPVKDLLRGVLSGTVAGILAAAAWRVIAPRVIEGLFRVITFFWMGAWPS